MADLDFGGEYLPGLGFSLELVVSVLVLLAVLVIASLFIFKFYKLLPRRNLVSLNLYKYNNSDHSITSKILAIVFYLLEYVFFIPFLIMLWFALLSIFIVLVNSYGLSIDHILWVTAGLIGAIRVLSYFQTEISTDLAKLFPFASLSFLILSAGKFNLDVLIENFNAIPSLLIHIYSFLIIIFIIEVSMRVIYTFYKFLKRGRSSGATLTSVGKKRRN